ncbi:MAG: hypothetical protein A3F13_09210 [Gammaproteobacteria bacterium RIFCSPHIGHO2_12_FULL_40_19]|nr:MAG: hypothetical protein A3F13_09210 [Gammaproteobacteria bacterium RIFCSPHIGHO2_12_FULL_40_19]
MRANVQPPTTYVLWDLETTGLNPAHDQIIQFAAIRGEFRDGKFAEIERYNIRIKLSEDIIPHPQALLVNRTSVELFNEGISEYEAVKLIHEIMNKPGTINLGYNSLGFDDEFIRFAFFKHLLPPYRHQFANGCYRMDIYPMVQMAYQLCPDLLRWPMRDGKISLKLAHLVQENNLSSGTSHDALVDVLDTIAIMEKLYSNAGFWREATAFFKKEFDKTFYNGGVPTRNITIGGQNYSLGFLMGHTEAFPALCLGTHAKYKNQTRWLRLDGDIINDRASRKKQGEPPFLFSYNDPRLQLKLSESQKVRIEDNLRYLAEHPDVFLTTKERHLNEQYPETANADVNAALYLMHFAETTEEKEKERTVEHLLKSFHLLEDPRKHEIVEKLRQVNKTHKELMVRLMARLITEGQKSIRLSAEDNALYQNHLARVFSMGYAAPIFDHRGQPKLTLPAAIAETEKLLTERTGEEDTLFLMHLKEWYQSHIGKYQPTYSTHAEIGLQTNVDDAAAVATAVPMMLDDTDEAIDTAQSTAVRKRVRENDDTGRVESPDEIPYSLDVSEVNDLMNFCGEVKSEYCAVNSARFDAALFTRTPGLNREMAAQSASPFPVNDVRFRS